MFIHMYAINPAMLIVNYWYGCNVQVMFRQGRLAAKRKYEWSTRQCTSLTVSIDIAFWKKARVLQQLSEVTIVEALLPPGKICSLKQAIL